MPINPAFAADDLDNDGVDDSMDSCPNLQEDYEGTIDGCPSNFVPWYDEDYDGIEDHIDQCPNLKETYNKLMVALIHFQEVVLGVQQTLTVMDLLI
jgi:hypothetical protein